MAVETQRLRKANERTNICYCLFSNLNLILHVKKIAISIQSNMLKTFILQGSVLCLKPKVRFSFSLQNNKHSTLIVYVLFLTAAVILHAFSLSTTNSCAHYYKFNSLNISAILLRWAESSTSPSVGNCVCAGACVRNLAKTATGLKFSQYPYYYNNIFSLHIL